MQICDEGVPRKDANKIASMSYDGLFCDMYEFLELLLRSLEYVNNYQEQTLHTTMLAKIRTLWNLKKVTGVQSQPG